MKRFIAAVLMIAVAFTVGYLPERLKLEALERETKETQERLESRIADVEADNRVAHIHSQLGMLILETEQQNFATALKRSSELFDAIAEAIPMTNDLASRTALLKLSKQRDSVTSALTTAGPEAAQKLKELYWEFGKTTRTKLGTQNSELEG